MYQLPLSTYSQGTTCPAVSISHRPTSTPVPLVSVTSLPLESMYPTSILPTVHQGHCWDILKVAGVAAAGAMARRGCRGSCRAELKLAPPDNEPAVRPVGTWPSLLRLAIVPPTAVRSARLSRTGRGDGPAGCDNDRSWGFWGRWVCTYGSFLVDRRVP